MSKCQDIVCGEEAACILTDNIPKCFCLSTMEPPDVSGFCPTNGQIVNATNIHTTPFQLTALVMFPVISMLTFIVATLIVIFRKELKEIKLKRLKGPRVHSRFMKLISKMGQTKVDMELEQLRYMSSNPNYMLNNATSDSRNTLKVLSRDICEIEKVMGEGNFGYVYKGNMLIDQSNTIPVAIKTLKGEVSDEDLKKEFIGEAQILSAFNHHNIVTVYGIFHDELDQVNIVLELLENGDLNSILKSNDPSLETIHKFKLDNNLLLDFAIQICSGMEYLSKLKYIHRDLATRNCLVSGNLVAKIADFGLSRQTDMNNYYRIGGERQLPIRWMANESISHGMFTQYSDVWSFGILLWELYSFGKQPYPGKSNDQVVEIVKNNHAFENLKLLNNSSINSTIETCLQFIPTERQNFSHHLKTLRKTSRNVINN